MHLVVSVVVVEEARGGATSVVVGAAHKQRWWRVVRVVAELQWKHGCGYGGGDYGIETKIVLWLFLAMETEHVKCSFLVLFFFFFSLKKESRKVCGREGTGQGKKMQGARGDCVGPAF